uniref:Protein LURP-one-related 15 n=1 Tax=Aegilops tauschii TaxID=37682 RepID=M8BEF1_AEGTA
MVDGKFLASHPTAFAVTKLHTWMGAVLAVRNSATGAAVMEVETVEVGYRNLRALVLLDAASRRPLLTGNSTAHPDYVVHGSYFKGAMTVSRGGGGGEDVAQIGKEDGSKSSVLSGEHTYHVNIDPDVDQALVLALTVIVDQRHNYDFESSSCSCNHSSHHASRSTGSRSHH